LNKFNIPSIIHYPIPIHQTQIFGTHKNKDFIFNTEMTDLLCDRILSLPIHPFMTEEETSKVIEVINLWSSL
jgi:dTDP-4-amino-4,6-dideoxygalactose transaminase